MPKYASNFHYFLIVIFYFKLLYTNIDICANVIINYVFTNDVYLKHKYYVIFKGI